MKFKIILPAMVVSVILVTLSHAQNIGINTTSPLSRLHTASITGNNLMLENLNSLSSASNNSIYFTNNVNSPDLYKYTAAIKVMGTSNNSARMGLFTYATNTTSALKERLSILDNGNVGIGKTDPGYALDVAGTGNFEGDLTVDDGKGIMRSANSTQLKYFTREVSFDFGLGANVSVDGTIGFANANFSSPPHVFIGDMLTGTGEFHKLQLFIYDVTPTGCKVRAYNDSNAFISVQATWSVICIGN